MVLKSEGQSHISATGGGLPKVLLIDNSEWWRRFMAHLLEEARFDVTVAFDGDDGLLKYSPNRFDFVVCDREMEERSGDELAAAIRRMSPRQDIVMLTANIPGEDEKEGIGATIYFGKHRLLDAGGGEKFIAILDMYLRRKNR